jgi:putative intracellular protease/amidase
MHIAILTFEGFNELDSLIALGMLHRATIKATIATPTATVTSMNGVTIHQMSTLEEACEADAVVVGSGIATREVVEDPAIMNVLRRLDPERQLIAAQCSGALVLARLGLLDGIPACTDLTSKPWVVAGRGRGGPALCRPGRREGGVHRAGGAAPGRAGRPRSRVDTRPGGHQAK